MKTTQAMIETRAKWMEALTAVWGENAVHVCETSYGMGEPASAIRRAYVEMQDARNQSWMAFCIENNLGPAR